MQCLKELVYHCVVMFYNHAKVIIEIQHIVVTSSWMKHFLDNCLKLIAVQKLVYNHGL